MSSNCTRLALIKARKAPARQTEDGSRIIVSSLLSSGDLATLCQVTPHALEQAYGIALLDMIRTRLNLVGHQISKPNDFAQILLPYDVILFLAGLIHLSEQQGNPMASSAEVSIPFLLLSHYLGFQMSHVTQTTITSLCLFFRHPDGTPLEGDKAALRRSVQEFSSILANCGLETDDSSRALQKTLSLFPAIISPQDLETVCSAPAGIPAQPNPLRAGLAANLFVYFQDHPSDYIMMKLVLESFSNPDYGYDGVYYQSFFAFLYSLSNIGQTTEIALTRRRDTLRENLFIGENDFKLELTPTSIETLFRHQRCVMERNGLLLEDVLSSMVEETTRLGERTPILIPLLRQAQFSGLTTVGFIMQAINIEHLTFYYLLQKYPILRGELQRLVAFIRDIGCNNLVGPHIQGISRDIANLAYISCQALIELTGDTNLEKYRGVGSKTSSIQVSNRFQWDQIIQQIKKEMTSDVALLPALADRQRVISDLVHHDGLNNYLGAVFKDLSVDRLGLAPQEDESGSTQEGDLNQFFKEDRGGPDDDGDDGTGGPGRPGPSGPHGPRPQKRRRPSESSEPPNEPHPRRGRSDGRILPLTALSEGRPPSRSSETGSEVGQQLGTLSLVTGGRGLASIPESVQTGHEPMQIEGSTTPQASLDTGVRLTSSEGSSGSTSTVQPPIPTDTPPQELPEVRTLQDLAVNPGNRCTRPPLTEDGQLGIPTEKRYLSDTRIQRAGNGVDEPPILNITAHLSPLNPISPGSRIRDVIRDHPYIIPVVFDASSVAGTHRLAGALCVGSVTQWERVLTDIRAGQGLTPTFSLNANMIEVFRQLLVFCRGWKMGDEVRSVMWSITNFEALVICRHPMELLTDHWAQMDRLLSNPALQIRLGEGLPRQVLPVRSTSNQ